MASSSIVGRALLGVRQDVIGAHELPESQRGIRIVGIDVRMGRLSSLAERGPQAFSVIARKSSEQIV